MANAQLKEMLKKQMKFPIYVKYEPTKVYMMDPSLKSVEEGISFVESGTFRLNERKKVLEPATINPIKQSAPRKRKRVPTEKAVESEQQQKKKYLKLKYPVSKKEVKVATETIVPPQEEEEEDDSDEYE